MTILVLCHVGRVKFCKLCQLVRGQHGKNGRSKGEVVPLIQPIEPHVDGSEVLYVVAGPWLDVVEGGCYYGVQVLFAEDGFKED